MSQWRDQAVNHFKRYVFVTLVALCLVIAFAMTWGVMLQKAQDVINDYVLDERTEVMRAFQLLEDLDHVIGYGGVIHEFKNYVLRRDESYARDALRSFADLDAIENELRPLLHSPESRASLDQILAVMDEYRINLGVAMRMVDQGAEPQDIDALVRVDDAPAFSARNTLNEIVESRYQKVEKRTLESVQVMNGLVSSGPLLFIPVFLLGALFLTVLNRVNRVYGELNDSKKAVDLLLETTPDSVLAVSENGVIVRANKTASEYFGYEEGLVGKRVEELMPESARAAHVHQRLNYFRSPEVRAMAPSRRVLALLANGETREVAVKLGFFNPAAGRVAVISIRDITEENRSRHELQESQKRMDFAADVANFGLWEFDIEEGSLILDIWAHRMHKLAPGVLGGSYQKWLKTIPSSHRTRVDQEIQAVIKDGADLDIEYGVALTDSDSRWLQLSAGIQLDDDGNPVKLTGVCRDITAIRNSRRALEKARTQALEASRVKSEFLANMSHEIRTPMNAIIGLLTMLEQSGLQDRQKYLARSAYSSAKSLLGILNDILDFSKLEAGKFELLSRDFELEDVLGKTIDLFVPAAQSKGLGFFLDVDPQVVQVLNGDSLRLGQVLANLISNSIKFTQKGYVELSISSVKLEGRAPAVRFSVRDTGVGMSKEQRMRVLEPFAQGDNSATRYYGGTGLGLPISSSLLALMNSDLKIKSSPGQGTEASFVIPTNRDGQTERFADLKSKDERVLVAIKDEALRVLVQKYLHAWSASVISCANLNQALAILREPNLNVDSLVTDFGNSRESSELLAICNVWTEVNAAHRDNIISLQSATFDQGESLPDCNCSMRIVMAPPTPARLFAGLRKCEISVGSGASPSDGLKLAIQKASGYRGARILVVEDVLTNQMVAKDYLETLGMQVDLASNGEEAIRKVNENAYACVLMDVHMPGMNGLETTRAIRAGSPRGNLPIIAMTAAAFESDKRKALSAGMDDYLTKPVDIVELAETLARHISDTHHVRAGGQQKLAARQEISSQPTPHFSDDLPAAIDSDLVIRNYRQNYKLYVACLRAFETDFSDWVDITDLAERQGERAQILSLLHKLKGASANIGATTLADLALKAQIAEEPQFSERLLDVTRALIQFLEDIKTIGLDSTRDKPEWAQEIAISPADSLAAINKMREYLMQQRYIPADVLDTWLRQMPSNVSPDCVEELQKKIELFDFEGAISDLDAIIEQVHSD